MQAIVTGASRGLGLALTRALAERGWRVVVDARDGDALERAVGGLDGVVALAGDVADPDHRRRLVEAAGDSIDLLVNNASVLGPSPQPRAGGLPARRASARLRDQRARAARARAARAAAACRRGTRSQHHLRRCRRGLRDLGRLRLVQGGAGADQRRARRREPRASLLRGRPGRHAHADAPGGVPRRGHLRPAAARGERSRAPRS